MVLSHLILAWIVDKLVDVAHTSSPSVGIYIGDYIAKRPFVLGLPTGSSPIPTYKHLIGLHKAGKISFENIVTSNMDEYVGLPQDHSESYHTFMFREFLSHTDIPPKNVHILNGNAVDLTGECKAYEQAIKDAGEEGVKHLWTLSALQLHPWALIIAEEDATNELHVKTVNYFKSVERVQEEVERNHEEVKRNSEGRQGNTW
ncbi:nagb/rpia/CoA transferase-like protein [Sistotremastrum suecicum HHB10207 ss-3]|uniref:glucosamine-6-phosphate deaminase n=1 Tax=Sistotremastrum suecicum HHB10207 ss-3 TaxID=1314776 RepID=A0A165YN97_9AGAM|nr:nagb/rpia/CoA transferase-like protein [Sistotremastrum suecicum HHB10207 ss-3]